ncbi:MAG TPA: tetratricopeptide repeat protein [Ktedonosporobacter sp.]|nr:tetratricopeptide repeat protein [Ktedonosporobacter sp.]
MPGNREVFSTAINAADHNRWNSQWGVALAEYQRALDEFPDDATAHSGLGFCYMQMKQWQQALDEYQSILKSDPQNVIVLSKTAELYVILNRRDSAYAAYLHLADLYAQAGQGPRAQAAWQKAVQLAPENPEPHERLASYYFEKKDITAMIQQRLAAAQCYFTQRQFELARLQCEEVLRADGQNAQAQRLLKQISDRAESSPLGGADSALPTGRSKAEEVPPQVEGTPISATHRSESDATQTSPVGLSPSGASEGADTTSDSLAFTENPVNPTVTSGNLSGGNTGIMGNMGSAGNYGGGNNPGMAPVAGVAPGMGPAPHRRITASQVTGVLKQA